MALQCFPEEFHGSLLVPRRRHEALENLAVASQVALTRPGLGMGVGENCMIVLVIIVALAILTLAEYLSK